MNVVRPAKDPHADWLKIWKFFSKDEFTYYKQNFPNDEAGSPCSLFPHHEIGNHDVPTLHNLS